MATLTTETAREGDRFTLTVRQPTQIEGATIEGHVSNVERSGRITGRSQMTLNFDTIRLRNGSRIASQEYWNQCATLGATQCALITKVP